MLQISSQEGSIPLSFFISLLSLRTAEGAPVGGTLRRMLPAGPEGRLPVKDA